jgi:hypothetical protein
MMMTDRETKEMAELDALLGDMRKRADPEVSDGLMARILADADSVRTAGHVTQPTQLSWRDWISALGGWPAMGGLVAAGVAGLWIGAAPIGTVTDVMAGVFGETVSVELFPDVDLFELEAEG